ncbi:flagellar basal-body rod protein FlgG [Metabacillus crassostreae]|uniref:flagellar hook-basal body protein n=1 Tax=Metabacillus crassostreae TaxID=929098 RepID=UPI00195C22B0|nr:flagellar hook-basal body protein [Metabacillus crassostreae]MBM7605352.1 flagellar basal-body rod protein FlgG [Metabacillus crassostreae]
MLRSMVTATNSMTQFQKQLDRIGHNLANVDTQGFKRTETAFSELVRQQFTTNTKETANELEDKLILNHELGIMQGVGAKLNNKLVFTQGSVKQTGRSLDIALTVPNQFLQIDVDGEINYTRDGALYLSPTTDGTDRFMLTTASGNRVLDENQDPIYLNDNFKEIVISQDGTLSTVPNNDTELPQIFELGIVGVDRPQMLIENGNNLYGLKDLGDIQINDVLTFLDGADRAVQQGALEMSNVDLTKEMTDLMISQRSYQMNAKTVTLGDQMLGLINGVR